MDVLPAAAGRLLCSVTVTVSPLWTMRVGPGNCICPLGHEPAIAAGAKPAGAALQP
jgi:hypothetical protein